MRHGIDGSEALQSLGMKGGTDHVWNPNGQVPPVQKQTHKQWEVERRSRLIKSQHPKGVAGKPPLDSAKSKQPKGIAGTPPLFMRLIQPGCRDLQRASSAAGRIDVSSETTLCQNGAASMSRTQKR